MSKGCGHAVHQRGNLTRNILTEILFYYQIKVYKFQRMSFPTIKFALEMFIKIMQNWQSPTLPHRVEADMSLREDVCSPQSSIIKGPGSFNPLGGSQKCVGCSHLVYLTLLCRLLYFHADCLLVLELLFSHLY